MKILEFWSKFMNRYKKFLLSSNLFDIFKCIRKFDYLVDKCYPNDYLDELPIEYLPYADFIYYKIKYPRLYNEFSKIMSSHRCKTNRIKKRIIDIVQPNGVFKECLFLTLTFNDDTLDKTSQKTRRTYVARFLKSQAEDYVANIDFGDKYNREHYHVVYGGDYINPLAWSYGTCNIKHIYNCNNLPNYINKLSYHSTKDTTGYAIYSRKVSA